MGKVTAEIKRDAYLQQLIERKDNGISLMSVRGYGESESPSRDLP